jgi:hypothetical protein
MMRSCIVGIAIFSCESVMGFHSVSNVAPHSLGRLYAAPEKGDTSPHVVGTPTVEDPNKRGLRRAIVRLGSVGAAMTVKSLKARAQTQVAVSLDQPLSFLEPCTCQGN